MSNALLIKVVIVQKEKKKGVNLMEHPYTGERSTCVLTHAWTGWARVVVLIDYYDTFNKLLLTHPRDYAAAVRITPSRAPPCH